MISWHVIAATNQPIREEFRGPRSRRHGACRRRGGGRVFTRDCCNIKEKDRIGMVGQFSVSDAHRTALLALGIAHALDPGQSHVSLKGLAPRAKRRPLSRCIASRLGARHLVWLENRELPTFSDDPGGPRPPRSLLPPRERKSA